MILRHGDNPERSTAVLSEEPAGHEHQALSG